MSEALIEDFHRLVTLEDTHFGDILGEMISVREKAHRN